MKVALSVAAVVALASVQAGTGAESASRIVDRTLLCRMTGVGYPDPARMLRVGVATYNPGTSDLPSSISVSNGGSGTGTHVQIATGGEGQPPRGYVYYGRSPCSSSNLRVPLSRKSLSGGQIDFHGSYDCDVTPRVLIRVQGIFERPPRVTQDGTARGDLVHGYLAVATLPDRTPVAFTSIGGGSQKTKVYVASSLCREDS